MHSFVRLRFIYAADADLVTVGRTLDNLLQLRTTADYELQSAAFADDTEAQTCLSDATDALALLDIVEADPARRVAAIAAMRTRWP